MTRIMILGALVAIAGIVSVAASDKEQAQGSLLTMLEVGQVVKVDNGPGGYSVRIWSDDQVTREIASREKRHGETAQIIEQQRKRRGRGRSSQSPQTDRLGQLLEKRLSRSPTSRFRHIARPGISVADLFFFPDKKIIEEHIALRIVEQLSSTVL